jgi:hypothetical protein
LGFRVYLTADGSGGVARARRGRALERTRVRPVRSHAAARVRGIGGLGFGGFGFWVWGLGI